jgi:MFS family permease
MTAVLAEQEAGFFHPSRAAYRFTILFFVAFITYGSYFAYDSIGAIAPMIIEAMKIGREQIGMMYSFYSWPNIVMVFLGGFLIDRIGTRRASILFSSLVFLGSVIVAAAKTFPLMLAGRILFGIGSESMIVAQSAILAKWFKGKELAFAFGVALTISRLGTLFSFNTESAIAHYFNDWRMALWAAAFFCFVSLLFNVIYIILDRRGERVLHLKEEETTEKIRLSDVKSFKPSFWYISLLCVTFYSAIFPFTAFSTDFFHEKWGLPLTTAKTGGIFSQVFNQITHMFTTAGGVTSIIIFASMILAPFLGRMVDKIGRRGTLMIVGSLMMIPSYLVMGFTDIYPAYPMVVLGLAFSLVPAAMWPAVPLIVKKEHTGTAFGLMTMIQNFGLATFPWVVGKLRDITQDYRVGMVVFATLGLLGLAFAILLKRADAKEGSPLERVRLEESAG